MTELEDIELMALADGQLPPAEARRLLSAIEADPERAAALERHRRVGAAVRSAYVAALEKPVPVTLLAPLRAPRATRSDRARRPALPLSRLWGSRAWPRLAATLVIGLAVGLALRPFIGQAPTGPLRVRSGGEIVAAGTLARALDNQLASTAQPGDVRIGVSFRTGDGDYCRTFQMAAEGLAGLACRDASIWRARAIARAPISGPPQGYRMAASSMPPAVLSEMDALIVGEPLDGADEARARDRRWAPERSRR